MTKLKFTFFVLLLSVFISISSCELFDNSEDTLPENTIEELVNERQDYSLFKEAVERTGVGLGSRTHFVPRNSAFEAYLDGRSIADIDIDELTTLMEYHSLYDEYQYSVLPAGYSKSPAYYRHDGKINRMDIHINTANTPEINGKVMITVENIVKEDGIIHEVDQVILPPTTIELAEIHGLDSFVAAVDLVGLRPLISGNGPYSIYAPTNEAFRTVMAQKGWNSISDITFLEGRIKDHIFENAIVLTDAPETLDAIGGVRVFFTGANVLIDDNQNDCELVDRNIQGVNGVLHTIDDFFGIL